MFGGGVNVKYLVLHINQSYTMTKNESENIKLLQHSKYKVKNSNNVILHLVNNSTLYSSITKVMS